MKPGLLRPGAFLLGMTLIIIGAMVFALIPALPAADLPGGTAANSQLLGAIGGAMIGVGLVAILIGLIRTRR